MDAPERLKVFLNEREMSERDAASQLSCSQAHVNGILNGRCRPGADLRVAIERLTAAAAKPILFSDWTPPKVAKLPKRRRALTRRVRRAA